MSTPAYVPPARDLSFLPSAPPLAAAAPTQEWALEIGPGKGELLLHQAAQFPQVNFIALEIRRGRFEKIAKQAQLRGLKNIYMIWGDARECLPRLFSPSTFKKIYVLFPDPWPKRRHSKHRLLKPSLIKILHGLLKAQGEIHNATDAGFYSEEIIAAFQAAGGFACQASTSLFPTYFEKKWQALGREIAYWKFIKL